VHWEDARTTVSVTTQTTEANFRTSQQVL